MKHKHYELIVAWANGAEIEYKSSAGRWMPAQEPVWDKSTEYRVKPQLHPWQQYLVDAVLEGKTVEYYSRMDNTWEQAEALHHHVANNMMHEYVWSNQQQYRVKSTKIVKYCWIIKYKGEDLVTNKMFAAKREVINYYTAPNCVVYGPALWTKQEFDA